MSYMFVLQLQKINKNKLLFALVGNAKQKQQT